MADYIRPTPRNPFLGGLADLLEASTSPERTQQMQGIMSMLGVPAVASTLNRISYGAPLTSGAGGLGGTTRVLPDVLDAALAVAPMAPAAGQLAKRAVMATKGLPVGASTKAVNGMDFLKPTEYRGSHKAPSPDFGAPLHDLTGGGQMYPADVYSAKAAQYYGTGYPKADKEAFALAQRVRGNPDAEITMYRAVPKDESITNINAGDWVSLSKDYAKTHGESVLQGDYKILSQKVKAKDLWTNADSIHEFGYQPQNQTPAFQYPQEEALRLAQQRAALPVEQYGLGLPAGNTAQQRAKAMGFDTDAYHGTKSTDIKKFMPEGGTPEGEKTLEWYKNRQSQNEPVGYMSFRSGSFFSPKPEYAGHYTGEGTGAMYPVKLQMDNPLNLLPNNAGRYGVTNTPDARKTIDAMVLQDSIDKSINEISIINPDQIRSINAAFDPFRRNAAIAAATGALAPDLLAAQEDEAMRQRQLGLLNTIAP